MSAQADIELIQSIVAQLLNGRPARPEKRVEVVGFHAEKVLLEFGLVFLCFQPAEASHHKISEQANLARGICGPDIQPVGLERSVHLGHVGSSSFDFRTGSRPQFKRVESVLIGQHNFPYKNLAALEHLKNELFAAPLQNKDGNQFKPASAVAATGQASFPIVGCPPFHGAQYMVRAPGRSPWPF
jgi:hypothetical protein